MRTEPQGATILFCFFVELSSYYFTVVEVEVVKKQK